MEKVSPFLCLIIAAIFLVNLKDLWKTESMIGLLCYVTWFHECKLSCFFLQFTEVIFHIFLLSKLVCTKIKTSQSFCVHFLRFNLNFQRNISPKHDKGHGYAFVKQVKSFPKMHKASFLFARK